MPKSSKNIDKNKITPSKGKNPGKKNNSAGEKPGKQVATGAGNTHAENQSEAGESQLFGLFNEIGIIAQLSNSEFEKSLPGELTSSQFSVLNWFARVDSEATPGRLAKAFQVTGGAMTNTLKKLEAKGLIKVEPDANSGRQKRVTMTRAGKVMRERAIIATEPLLIEFAEQFPLASLKPLLGTLQEIRRYLDERRA